MKRKHENASSQGATKRQRVAAAERDMKMEKFVQFGSDWDLIHHLEHQIHRLSRDELQQRCRQLAQQAPVTDAAMQGVDRHVDVCLLSVAFP